MLIYKMTKFKQEQYFTYFNKFCVIIYTHNYLQDAYLKCSTVPSNLIPIAALTQSIENELE